MEDEDPDLDLEDNTFAVDIPQCFNGDPIDEWRCVETFSTREEALKFAQEHFGADENGMICLISEY
jgi:hypothetical protein